jgi:GNAT superfamily N-acetyltransferase
MVKEPHRPIFVAIIDAQIVGFVSGSASREKQEYDAEITAFYVLDTYQGRGVGKLLFESMIEEFRKRNYISLYLWVLSEGPARGFYEYM